MATMQTNELTGAALNFIVELIERDMVCHTVKGAPVLPGRIREFSTDWAHGGPIIERECVAVAFDGFPQGWIARTSSVQAYGPTPLIAAMRCYVASRLGDIVGVPDKLPA